MLSSENLYSVKFFDYNAENRMKLSTVTDLTEHTYTATTYAYDGLGRRTLTQTEGHTATRTLYDGTGFEILRQGTADSNGSFVNYTEAQTRYSPYNPYGGGYYGNRWGYADYFYYLFFGGMWGFGAGGHGSKKGQEEAPEYLTIENMYPLYANGTVAGSYKEDLVYSPHQHYWNSWTNFWGADTSRHDDYATYKETLYFGTDILGSVRSATDSRSVNSGSVSYDVFGSPYRRTGSFQNDESLDFGYLGKPYNASTELYDYGFRDYSPKTARFTTVDPIRDGRNWYAYVLNDPVNFVDWWGLCKTNDQRAMVVGYNMGESKQSYTIAAEYTNGNTTVTIMADGTVNVKSTVATNIVIISLDDSATNNANAVTGTMEIFRADQNSNYNTTSCNVPDITVPVVSGGFNGAKRCNNGVYLDVKEETSTDDTLTDGKHDEIVYRLYADFLIHQGQEGKDVNTANTEGCVGVTGDTNNSAAEYYKDVKQYMGGNNIVIVK